MGATLVSPRRPRVAAQERRDLVLDAAVAEFGAHGWHGARIEAIAARAGISHPYLLRLFASKRKLFMTATDRAFDRMEAAFTEPVAHDEVGTTRSRTSTTPSSPRWPTSAGAPPPSASRTALRPPTGTPITPTSASTPRRFARC